MIDVQIIAAIIFFLLLTIFLYVKRKNLDTKYLVPYVLYFSMYKTKWGIKLMDSMAKKFRRFFAFIGYFGILIGFLGMILICFALSSNVYAIFTKPSAPAGVGLVLPFKGKGIFYVPFFYYIISIFIIAVVHEFSHGLIARTHKLKVKSSGFAFLGFIIPIIPAAFVEPDEKELQKRPMKEQLSIFAAGPLANIITAALSILILFLVVAPLSNSVIQHADGVVVVDYIKDNQQFPIEKSGIKPNEIILKVDNFDTPYLENLTYYMKTKKPNEFMMIKTNVSVYRIQLTSNPQNQSSAFMGAQLEQNSKIKDEYQKNYFGLLPGVLEFIVLLLYFLYTLNLGIGLINLAPMGPLDGGRMLQLPLIHFFGEEKGKKIWLNISLVFLVLILVNLGAAFIK